MGKMPILDNIYKGCITWLARLSAVLLLSIMFLVTIHVIGRYVFKKPIPFTVEYSEYMMAIVVFLTTPLVFARDGHIRIDILLTRLNARNRALFEYFISWILVFLFLLLTCCGALLTYDHLVRGQMIWKTVVIPLWILDVFIPIMCFLLFIGAIGRTQAYWRLIRKGERK
jgi:TRAP-type C4-dicarboxylate transport system permease small subunit